MPNYEFFENLGPYFLIPSKILAFFLTPLSFQSSWHRIVTFKQCKYFGNASIPVASANGVFFVRRFYRQFFQFSLYFLLSLICFTLRPGPSSAADGNMQVTSEIPEMTEITYAEKIIRNDNESASEMLTRKHSKRYSRQEFNYSVEYSKNASTDLETTTPSFESWSVNGSGLNMNNDVLTSNQQQRYYNVADSRINSTENSSNDFFTTEMADVLSTTFYDEVSLILYDSGCTYIKCKLDNATCWYASVLADCIRVCFFTSRICRMSIHTLNPAARDTNIVIFHFNPCPPHVRLISLMVLLLFVFCVVLHAVLGYFVGILVLGLL